MAKKVHSQTLIPAESSEFTWSIKNFSLCNLKGEECLKSPIFTTGESYLTTWYLQLYPNENEFISLYLNQTSSDSSAYYVNFNFSIIQLNGSKSCIREANGYLFEASKRWGSKKFIERKTLFKEQSSLLPSDTLTVRCEMKVSRVNDGIVSNLTKETKSVNSASIVFKDTDSLSDNLKDLYEKQILSDFTIKVGAEEFKVHKLILCARSPVFNTMLNCDMKENITNSLEITDFDPPVVKTMLRYIYCGRLVGITPETSVQLYSAAEKYNLLALKDICAKYLSANLNIDNICEVLILGELHEDEQLKIASRNFICMNAARIQETEKWVSLTKSKPDLVLAMNQIVISQMKKCF